MPDAKRSLELFDNSNASNSSDDDPDFINSERYDQMLAILELFMNYAQPFPRYHDDIQLLQAWLDNKREEQQEHRFTDGV